MSGLNAHWIRCGLLLAIAAIGGCAASGGRDAVQDVPAAQSAPAADAGAAADGAGVPYEIVRRRDTYRAEGSLREVRIVNRYGDLRVRMADENALGVQATIQRIGTTPRDPEFDVQQSASRIDLVVRYPGDDPDAPVDLRRGRVDLVVFVRRDAALEVETASGTLDVKRADAPVTARTTSGTLAVSATGRLDLRTGKGRLFAKQMQPGWSGHSRVRSEQGPIQVGVPNRGDYRLEVEAGGGVRVTQDWKPGEIEVPPDDARRYSYTRGAGTSRITIDGGGSVEISPVILLDDG